MGNSDKKPFQVNDRRRFTTTDFRYKLPNDGTQDESDPYETFRIASFDGSDKPPTETTTAEKYKPVVVPTDSNIKKIKKVPYQAGDSGSRFMGLYIGAAAVAGLGLLFLLGRGVNNTGRNYTPPSSSVTQTQSYQSQPIYKPAEAKNTGLPAFEEYEKQHASQYNEFERSSEPALTPIPLQQGLIHPAYESGAEAFALDLNGDNRNETLIRVDNGAFSFVFSPEGREILHDNIMRISDSSTNGYLNVFTTRGATQGKGAKFSIRYAYDGQKYSNSARLMNQADIITMSGAMEELFGDMSNPGMMSMYLKNVEREIGTHNALMAFMQFQTPQDVPLLNGSELTEFLRLYDKETGSNFLDRYANDPAGFERATLSHAYDSMFFDTSNPKGWFLIGASAAAKSVAKSLNLDSESQFIARIDRMEQESGYVSAFRNATGRNPTLQEWTDLKYRSNAVTEDKLRTYQGSSETIGSTRTNPDGSSNYRGDIYPGATPEEMRQIQAQQRQQEIQQQSQENWQRAQKDLQRGVQGAQQGLQQGADAARKALEKILPPPKKK